MLCLMQPGLAAWLFQLKMRFAKCSLCAMRVVVSAGSRVPEKGLLGDGGSEAQVACRHTQSMTQLSPEEREGRRLQPHG